MNNKLVILVIAIILIAGSIFYLESQKIDFNGDVNKTELSVNNENSEIIKEKELMYNKAIEIVSPNGYINGNDTSISKYLGEKVILVDFWTYSCINCIRTFPYLNSWHDKYEDEGLVIIGVHSPEFDFEKEYDNVRMAVDKYGIKYPVVLDNEHQSWRAYNNRFWPRKYLIDIDGFIVYDHIGEGDYEETEAKIQELLEERKARLGLDEEISRDMVKPNATDVYFNRIQTPELYLGVDYSRDQMGNVEGYDLGKTIEYEIPGQIEPNKFYLSGKWLNNKDNLQSEENAELTLKYGAKQVNIVAGINKDESDKGNIKVYIDDNFIRTVEVSDSQLYTLYEGEDYSSHQIKLIADPNIRIFTFTFG